MVMVSMSLQCEVDQQKKSASKLNNCLFLQ
jgi:hypothetical protein